jgi:3-phosphoglycerate kinase
MFSKQTVRDIDLSGKTVLLRADYNVPLNNGVIADDYRLEQSLPTVEYLLKQASRLVICSHLGRPEGPDKENSLLPVAKRLQKLTGRAVEFVPDCVGEEVKKAAKELKPGGILLLENLRFHPEEKANDAGFAQQLAGLADVYVNDAFGVSHRADASLEAITHHLPGVAGLLLEKEMVTLTEVMEKPEHPLMAIIGGAKIADKLEVMQRFIEIADFVAVGGAMANTFLVAQGYDVGASLYDKAEVALAKHLIKLAETEAKKRAFVFAIPHDVVVAEKIDKSAPTRIVELATHTMADVENYPQQPPAKASKIHADERILDIGPFSASFIVGAMQLAKTVVMSGPMGLVETPSLHGPVGPTAHGTHTIVQGLIGDFGSKPFSVVGGGDSIAYLQKYRLTEFIDHPSTGGGASLEVLAGHKLAAVEALPDKK